MTNEAIIVALVSSAISGILSVIISSLFYSRLENRRIKLETARKMFGNKHAITGDAFQESINEIIIVFSDSHDVVEKVKNLFDVAQMPISARAPNAADDALIKLMKSICKNIGIKYKDLPDLYFLKYFNVPPTPNKTFKRRFFCSTGQFVY